MLMYCVKCKQKTDSINITPTVTTNNRKMIKSICSVCGSKKSTFIKSHKLDLVLVMLSLMELVNCRRTSSTN